MFFDTFNQLTAEAVRESLEKAKLPQGGEEIDFLKGLSFSLRLDGDFAPSVLSYAFGKADTLTVTENENTYEVSYGAKEFGGIILISHLIPGSDRGYHIILDKKSLAATVFETWFGITVPVGGDLFGTREPDHYRDIPREVQREIYFGWADTGKNEKPEKLHTYTNRIEGRGLHWDYSTGDEILSFNPSVICTTVVELGSQMGGITMTYPADYIRIDDVHYIIAKWEVQYSGMMWIDVINLFDSNAAGIELGFSDPDGSCFTYSFHTAEIETTGFAAHMELYNDNGDKGQPFMMMQKKKGARYSYRPSDYDVPMTKEEALKEAASCRHVFDPEGNLMESKYEMEISDKLVGRSFKVRPDRELNACAPWSGTGTGTYEYEILTKGKLRWRVDEGDWIEDEYVCFEPDKDLFFFAHFMTGEADYATLYQAVDFKTGLATTVRTGIGNWNSEWESGALVLFGTLEYGNLKAPFTRRHHYTDELLGLCWNWAYTDSNSSIHVYSSPESYSWTILQGNNSGGATWSSPCFYIKLRPDVYIFQWIEEGCNGSQGILVINRKLQHDGGFFYGVNRDHGVKIVTTGAYMRELGMYDIKKYFDREPK